VKHTFIFYSQSIFLILHLRQVKIRFWYTILNRSTIFGWYDKIGPLIILIIKIKILKPKNLFLEPSWTSGAILCLSKSSMNFIFSTYEIWKVLVSLAIANFHVLGLFISKQSDALGGRACKLSSYCETAIFFRKIQSELLEI
jgi:hypothetical protein